MTRETGALGCLTACLKEEAQELRRDAVVVIAAIDPEYAGDACKAAVYAQRLAGQAGLLDSPRPARARPALRPGPGNAAATRAFAARALVRVIALELDIDDEGNVLPDS